MEGVAEVGGAFAWLVNLDRDLTLAVNAWHNPATDSLWQFFSHIQIWYVMYLIIIVLFFIRLGWKKALVVTISCILFVVACDQFANVVKHCVQRLRPLEDADMIARGLHVLEGRGGLYGFFSGHAANSMGFAVCSSMGFRNDKSHNYRSYTIAICVWAVLVGLSRVFVGKHFLGDVLVGFVVGAIIGWGFAALARFCIRKIS